MSGQQVALPLLSEKEWSVVLAGLFLQETRERDAWYDRRAFTLYARQASTKGGVFNPPSLTPSEEAELNDLAAFHNEVRHKIFQIRAGIKSLDSQQTLNNEIEKLTGEGDAKP